VERDIGVLIQDNLKVSEQCNKAANTADRSLGMINRTFSYKPRVLVNTLYKSLVRPHLEYCSQAWRQHIRKDIDTLEKVHRRASRKVTAFRGWSYDQRLRSLNWCTLEERRSRGDMMEVFKLLNGFDVVAPNTFVNRSSTGLRGMSLNYIKVASAQIWENFRFPIQLFRIGIVYRSILYQVTLLIHLKTECISITCTVTGLYKSHRLSSPCRSSSLLWVPLR